MQDQEFAELSQTRSNLERERSGPPLHLWRIPQGDTQWMDEVYDECYRLSMSRRGKKHKPTFEMVLTNICAISIPVAVSLDYKHYAKVTDRPEHIAHTAIGKICRDLEASGYVSLDVGYSRNDKSTEPTLVHMKPKLREVKPINFKSTIPKQGVLECRGFKRPEELPEDVSFRMNVLQRHNELHAPEHHLRAIYSTSMDKDGRFYGDIIQNIPKDERPLVTIDGEPTAEIDIRNCQPFLFYALHLGKPLEGDIYKIEGYPRELIKKAFAMALNCDSRRRALQALQGVINKKGEWKGYRAKEILPIVEQKFTGADDKLYCSEGLMLMNVDSGCMAKLLNVLNAKGIKRHPIHDGILCKISDLDMVLPLMKEAFTVNGFVPKVSISFQVDP